ncbi:regulator of chromosome condensation [Drosophila pseudoobscura]|uniref:Regulator of chromosome condensation n=1 Tax=Drosophila pseudoobscura pseudoobscura TaxID=46245 RepID=Q29E69_DROPS|nr:regulator of chromosome condensation [Drosophila pseudoobscura]
MSRRKAVTNNNNAGEAEAQPTLAKRARIAFSLDIPKRRQTVGTVLVCGTGDFGQLGLGEDIQERKRLAVVENIPNPVDVCAGGMHSLVLTENGDIYSFGCNDEGALGRDTSEDGSESVPALVHLPGKAVRISVGDSHSACILEDGSVYAWGSFRDSHGNMGLTIDGNKRVPANLLAGTVCSSIASGSDHLVILTTRGKVYTVGCAEQGQLGRISGRSVGGEGRRGKRDLLRPDQLIVNRTKPFEAIWATNYCTFLRESQTEVIWAVGLNNFKQLAYEQDEDLILHPIKTALKDIKQISGGIHHTLFLKNDQRCYVVGRPEYGRLGLGSKQDVVDQLTPANNLSDNIVHVGCGEISSYAITADGKLYSWGMGTNYQLGVGDGDDELEPVLVSGKNTQNRKMLLASGGGQHGLFLGEADAKELKEKNIPAAATSSKTDNIPLPSPITTVETIKGQKGHSKTPPKKATSKRGAPDAKNEKEIVPAAAMSSKKEKSASPPPTSTKETAKGGKGNSKTPPKKAAAKRGGSKKIKS